MAADLKTRFAFAYGYSSLSSRNAADFMAKLKRACPFEIKRRQTDNGGEFEKHFRVLVERENIVHFHNYPRRPRMNPNIERFNRTVKDQFVNWYAHDASDIETFNHSLMDYLFLVQHREASQGFEQSTAFALLCGHLYRPCRVQYVMDTYTSLTFSGA